jgi:hypothetical protein
LNQTFSLELGVRLEPFERQSRDLTHGAGFLPGCARHESPIAPPTTRGRVVSPRDVHDLVAIDHEGIAIRRDRLGRRHLAHAHDAALDHDAIGRARSWGRGGRTNPSTGQLRVRAFVAVDPEVRVRITARVTGHTRPRFNRRVIAAEATDSDLRLLTAAAHLIRATLIVGTAHGYKVRVSGPTRVIHLWIVEPGGAIDRDDPFSIAIDVDHGQIPMSPVEVPEQRCASVIERRPTAVAELLPFALLQLATPAAGHGKSPPPSLPSGEIWNVSMEIASPFV